MKKYFSILNIFFLLMVFYPVNMTHATNHGEIVIYGKSKIKLQGLSVGSKNEEGNIAVVSGADLERVKLKKMRGEIEAWGYREKYTVEATPNDTYYAEQWAMPKIDAPEAWDITTGSEDVSIAILDTGFHLSHPDLSSRFMAGFDYVDNDNDPGLPDGGGSRYYHGTLVAGAAAAKSNNALGVSGVDWGAKIMPIRVMDNNGSGYTDDIAAGIDYARINGADVINLSLGYHPEEGEEPDPVLEAAINNAYESGVTIIAASGNENMEVSYPAAFENVIAVGATDESDVRCDEGDWGVGFGSNYGPEIDVVAPGDDILTTGVEWNGSSYNSGYALTGGTSLATPIVAGLVSLLESRQNFTPNENKLRLINGSEKVANMAGQNFTNEYGFGRINAHNSLSSFSVNNLTISTLSFSLGYTKIVGQEMSANFSIKNNNIVPVLFDRIKIDIRGNGDPQDFLGGSNVTVEPGDSVSFSTLSSKRFLSDNGSFIAKIKVKINGTWRTLGSSRSMTIRNPRTTDFSFSPSLTVSPNPIYARSTITARYGLINKTAAPINVSKIKLDIRSAQRSQDMGGFVGRTLVPNTRFNFDLSKKINYSGYYKCTAVINIYGRWIRFSPSVYLRVR